MKVAVAAAPLVVLVPQGLFYGRLGVTPSEVGVTLTSVLGETAVGVALVVLLATSFSWALGRQQRADAERGGAAPPEDPAETRGERDQHPLLGPLAAVAAVTAVVMALGLAPTALWAAERVKRGHERHGLMRYSWGGPVPAVLVSQPVLCTRVVWHGDERPDGLPEHMLRLGQSAGTTVFYQAGRGPVRVPSASLTVLPAEPGRCRDAGRAPRPR